MKDCVFCKIIAGEIPVEKVYEDEKCLVILDRFPVMKGQCLVIIKKHEDYVFNLDDDSYNNFFYIAKRIAMAIDDSLSPDRTCLVVEGFEVQHAHIKLFPTFNKELKIHGGKEASNEDLARTAEKIRSCLGMNLN